MQLLKPLGIVDVGIATGDRLGIPGDDQHHFHSPSLKNLERRNPIHAGGLHRHRRNPQPFEPISQARRSLVKVENVRTGSASKSSGTVTTWNCEPISIPAARG